MAGIQVAPLLRSRRKPPLSRNESGGGMSGSWCCKLTVLGILAILALLTSFQNLRPLSNHSLSRKLGEHDWALEGRDKEGVEDHRGSIDEKKGSVNKKVVESEQASTSATSSVTIKTSNDQEKGSGSCQGIQNWELWGPATLAGDKNKQPSAKKCCASCRARCETAATCRCDSWVYCGDKEACKAQFQECWLKKQHDELKPEIRLDSTKSPWTSGMIYPPGKGVVMLETSHGKIRIQLAPDLAPRTVDYVRKVLGLKFCSGCQFYRAEGLGAGWTTEGKRTKAPPGPPYALLQGSLQADGLQYEELPKEGATIAERGTVCLIGGGPEFFISVGDHVDWETAHTVFGHVLLEDMEVVNNLVGLPTRKDVWGSTEVQVLESPVQFALKRAVAVSWRG